MSLRRASFSSARTSRAARKPPPTWATTSSTCPPARAWSASIPASLHSLPRTNRPSWWSSSSGSSHPAAACLSTRTTRPHPPGGTPRSSSLAPSRTTTKAGLVRLIFRRYGEGAAYRKLAVELNATGCPYAPGRPWNKNMVVRVLPDGRYTGRGTYPQIIPPESFQQAMAAKPDVSGRANHAEIKDIRVLARCAQCQSPMRRTRQNYWLCSHCMTVPAKIRDESLILCVERLLHSLREHSETIDPPPLPRAKMKLSKRPRSVWPVSWSAPNSTRSPQKPRSSPWPPPGSTPWVPGTTKPCGCAICSVMQSRAMAWTVNFSARRPPPS